MSSAPAPIEPAAVDEREAVRNAARDLEAARRRVERDAAKVRDDTRNQLVAELLPVLDNLDRSIAAGAADDPMLQGVKQVRSQLLGVLQGYGLERFDALGARFDPAAHDAVAMVDVTEPARDGTVVDQIEAGYRSSERLLRPAKVAVGRYQPPRAPRAAAPHPFAGAWDPWDPWGGGRR
jgi:molecular chaperone GrpE